ncbi:MAG: polyprenyl synthetase family protein [Rhodothermales bacterium]
MFDTDPPTMAPPASLSMNEVRSLVADDMKAFKRYFRESMRTDVGLLNTVTQYVLRQKGKQIRPMLVILAAKTCGEVTERTYRAAALVELLHTATLVHDDVVDEAETRRGLFSINALWKNKVAVLLGDFFLSRGLLLSLEHHDYAMLQALSDAVRRMSEGELLQLEKSRRLDIDEATYTRIISDKTASLIAACTTAGALSTTDDDEMVQRLKQLGEKLGLAFQIRDDLFDFGVKDVGKPIGIDIQEKKMTLPLIYALRETDKDTRKRIMKIIRKSKKTKDDIRTVSSFAFDAGGIAHARRAMLTYADEARALLAPFDDSMAKAALNGIIDYTVQRGK